MPGYGHLDGKDVSRMVREEVDRVCRRKGYKYVEADWKNTWEH